jgi:predicted enzyme related to lactoylglutathione lyase
VIEIQFPVLGVDDMDRAIAFWSALLGYRPLPGGSANWHTLGPDVDNAGARLALQLSKTPVQESPRMHLDLAVHGAQEQSAAAEVVCELGGQRVDWQQWPQDPDFIVVADTEGNRFCLVDLDHV